MAIKTSSTPATSREEMTLELVVPASNDFTRELWRCLRERPLASWHRLYIRTENGVIKLCRAEFGEDYQLQDSKKEDIDASESTA